MRTRVIILGAVIPASIFFGTRLYIYSSIPLRREREVLDRHVIEAGLEKARINWSSHEFISASNIEGLSSIINQSVDTAFAQLGQQNVDTAARTSAKKAIHDFFGAYADGSWNAFTKFRLPSKDYVVSAARQQNLRRGLANLEKIPDSQLNVNGEDLARIAWEHDLNKTKHYFLAVAPSTITVSVYGAQRLGDVSTDNFNKLFNGMSFVGVVTYNPYFFIAEQQQRDTERESLVLFVAGVFETPSPDGRLPIACKFFWSDHDKIWIPDRLFAGRLYGRHCHPFF